MTIEILKELTTPQSTLGTSLSNFFPFIFENNRFKVILCWFIPPYLSNLLNNFEALTVIQQGTIYFLLVWKALEPLCLFSYWNEKKQCTEHWALSTPILLTFYTCLYSAQWVRLCMTVCECVCVTMIVWVCVVCVSMCVLCIRVAVCWGFLCRKVFFLFLPLSLCRFLHWRNLDGFFNYKVFFSYQIIIFSSHLQLPFFWQVFVN